MKLYVITDTKSIKPSFLQAATFASIVFNLLLQ